MSSRYSSGPSLPSLRPWNGLMAIVRRFLGLTRNNSGVEGVGTSDPVDGFGSIDCVRNGAIGSIVPLVLVGCPLGVPFGVACFLSILTGTRLVLVGLLFLVEIEVEFVSDSNDDATNPY